MDVHDQQRLKKSRVVRVNSEELWDFFITQAANQGCPVMVHFTAAWCMPSVAMNSFFEELAFNYHDNILLLVDVDEGVAFKMEIKAMATFLMMKGGGSTEKLVGANPGAIKKMLKSE
ncbi:hypothetical protein ACE6H2_014772 [Prunus campanulata]